jgi:predicted phage-related endonuclease
MTREWSQLAKEPHGSQAWLAQRWANNRNEKLVSASVAACIYDKHPFKSAAQFAAELLRDTPPEPTEQTEAMERGNRLEPVLIEWANDKLGRNFVTPDVLHMFTDGDARMIATLDGYENGDILEIKTSTRDWTGVLPDYWLLQGVHQAVCANSDRVFWAVFDRSQSLHIHEQIVSSDEKETHIRAVARWLSYIDMGMTPDGVAWTYETITDRYPHDTQQFVELGVRAAELVSQLKHVRTERKSYEDIDDRLKAELCEMIGEAATALVGGEVVATWKTSTRKSLDQKALREAHPDLVDQYTKEVTIRTLRLKGND